MIVFVPILVLVAVRARLMGIVAGHKAIVIVSRFAWEERVPRGVPSREGGVIGVATTFFGTEERGEHGTSIDAGQEAMSGGGRGGGRD